MNDSRGVTYTSPELDDDLISIGHPVVHIHLKNERNSISLFVYLEKVHKDGFSEYITEGCLAAGYRPLSRSEKNDPGIPIHISNEHEIRNGSGDFAGEYVIDLQPTAYVFEMGSRIRITVTCADKDNASVEVTEPVPEIAVTLGGPNGSCLLLPEAE